MEDDAHTYRKALEDFHRYRSKAAMQAFWTGLAGESLDLIPYGEISSKLKAVGRTERGLQSVPLDAIVGSLGREDDFDRYFRPRHAGDAARWASVKTAMVSPGGPGVPPVSLYKIGELYFVLDGNHRVSIAKEMGFDQIEAYVTELSTRVPVPSDLSPENLVLEAAYIQFLEETQLDLILPEANLRLKQIQNYPLLKEHIAVHQYYMGQERGEAVSHEEAARHWYAHFYQPIAALIRSSGLAQAYKEWTTTDLYLWVLDQQKALQEELGVPVRLEKTADFFAVREGLPHSQTGEAAYNLLKDPETESPDEAFQIPGSDDCLFRDILVGVSDLDPGFLATRQAISMASCPGASVRGLHVLALDQEPDPEAQAKMKNEFDELLRGAGLVGKLSFASGEITPLLTDHSLLSDLLVLKLNFPPSTGGWLARFSSGVAALLRSAHRPVLFVKEVVQGAEEPLVLYNGSPQSKQALYIGAYLASRSGKPLHLLTLEEAPGKMEKVVKETREYLEKLGLAYDHQTQPGHDLAAATLSTLENPAISTLIMGGYQNTLLARLTGSKLDQILELVPLPILICP